MRSGAPAARKRAWLCPLSRTPRPPTHTHTHTHSPHICSFVVSVYSTQVNVYALAVNTIIVAILLIPKLPQLEGVRLFGINKGPADDE